MNKKVFVLAGDYGYIRQIETTLKSICYHNSDARFIFLIRIFPKSGLSPSGKKWHTEIVR